MGEEVAVALDSVSLCYRLATQRLPSFKDYTLHWLRGALVYQELWALRDVSFTLRRGESLGVVGRNGAGKSTLLKVLSGVLEPTRGRAVVQGLVAPVLELGAGFDHELTGLENVYLNGMLLGHTRREVEQKAGAIVDFSGLGDFVHAPIRNYSSGMLARLGFAVITAWVPDLLVLDEFLAVGDAHFVRRCEERLAELRAAGTTLVLVSHQPESIEANCARCLWLEQGVVRADGEPAEVLARYAAADAPAEIRPSPA